MALRRLIACCLGVAAGLLVLGCGSSGDSTSADIDPDIAKDFTDKLAVINAYAAEGECDRATEALGTLMKAVDIESDQTGEEFTSDLQDLLGQLEGQLQDQCQQVEETSSTTTEATDTEPTVTDDTEPTTTPTSTTTTTTTKDTTTTTTPTTPPTSPGNGNGNGPPDTPGGGIPAGKKKTQKAQDRKPKRDKKPKPGKHKEQGR